MELERLGPTLGPIKIPGVWENPPAAGGKKVVFRALPRALHFIAKNTVWSRVALKKKGPGYVVSQFQGMVLEEKRLANRPSFADVRRRNNEVSGATMKSV